MSAIGIGGTYVNNIPTIYGNVSLDVSGHTAIRGNLYVSGTANIDVSGGGFSGTDLSLNGNIYLGGSLYSTNASTNLDIYANTITKKSGDGIKTNLIEYYDISGYTTWEGQNNLTINTIDGKYFNATSGASMGFDASQNTSFTSRNGQISFSAEQGDMLFDSSLSIDITSRQGDIDIYPKNGTNGKLLLHGTLDLFDGITCREASSILNINTTDFMNVYGSTGTQINLYQTGVTTKSTSIGYDSSNNKGYVGSGGTNTDFSIEAGRYIRLQNPLYVDYTVSDITQTAQIGYQDSSSNTNNLPKATTRSMITLSNLPAGVWLLEGRGGWSHSDAGNRVLCWHTTINTLDRVRAVFINQNTTAYQQLECVTVVRNTTPTTWYLTARAGTSSGTLNNEEFYARWTRIA